MRLRFFYIDLIKLKEEAIMSYKRLIVVFLSITVCTSLIFPDVPPTRIHNPDIPYFMESMQFQTMQMNIFSPNVSGMVMDPYSDLIWNPAYILRQSQKSIYFDFNPQITLPIFSVPIFTPYSNYYDFSTSYMVLPRWYPTTSVSSVQTIPIYNFAALLPINSKISVALINRSIFDYGPFRSTTWWRGGGWASDLSYNEVALEDLETQRLEVDENQQTVFGNQSELLIGYKLSKKLDIGFRFGHYIFRRDGDLYDSKWAFYPHSSFADLNDESLKIDGDHIETGIGLIYHLNEKTHFGAYAGFTKGSSSEKVASLDTSDFWSERDTDSTYYSISEYYLKTSDSYTSEGKRPSMTITFEKNISSKLIFRSFLHGTWSNTDITGLVASMDTTYGDRTYDVWRNDTPHFQRRESHSSRENELDGDGKESINHWKWFASLIYAPNDDWSLFSGIQLQKYSFKQEIDETSDYYSHSWNKYTGYYNEENEYYYSHLKKYSFETNYDKWSVFIPVGIKAKVVKGLYVILGTDVILTLDKEKSEGKLLYPSKINRRWEDGTLIVEDIEENRYEEYCSDPAKNFNRSIQQRFGIVYKHPSGAKLYIKSGGDIFYTNNWALGFEMNW